MENARIFCPKCQWRPKPESRWQCVPECGTVWNTFWTGAVCPGCAHRWHVTQCLLCEGVSPHGDWYHYPEDPEADHECEQLEKPVIL
jgi:hypothetical protein